MSLDERVAILEEMRLVLWSPGFAQEVRASTNLSLLLSLPPSCLISFPFLYPASVRGVTSLVRAPHFAHHPRGQMVYASCRAKGFDPHDATMAPLVAEEWLMCAPLSPHRPVTRIPNSHAAPAPSPGP